MPCCCPALPDTPVPIPFERPPALRQIVSRADIGNGRPRHVKDRFTAAAPNRLWLTDIERREALFNRVEVEDLHHAAVAAVG